MRNATRLLVLAGALAIPTMGLAKRPQPIMCPSDIPAALAEACPCEGTPPWKNHGQYVRCVVHLRNALRKSRCFSDDSYRRTLARCAAKSTCGKADKVLCCFTVSTGTCSDPTPDGIETGTCSNDAALACDTSPDCTKSRVRIARDEAHCTADGGTSGGQGSVCDAGACSPSGAFLDPVDF